MFFGLRAGKQDETRSKGAINRTTDLEEGMRDDKKNDENGLWLGTEEEKGNTG